MAMEEDGIMHRRLSILVSVVALVGGACGGAATATPTTIPTTVATTAPTAAPTVAPTSAPTSAPTPAPTPGPTPSQAAVVRCAETPDVTPSATVQWNIPVVGGEPTIKAGQAVAFTTTGPSPTVTEGTNGKPAANACIDKTIGSDVGQMTVVVTFYQPGDYSITCRKIPEDMHTVVHVH
jgi:plastocyanin